MELKLSCFKCGSTNLKEDDMDWLSTGGDKYIYSDTSDRSTVICSNCGMKDYVGNLVAKYFNNEEAESIMSVRLLNEGHRQDVILMDEQSGDYVREWLDTGMAYGLFRGDKLVSCCTMGYADECGDVIDNYEGKTSDSYMLSNLYTLEGHRDMGYATTLVREAINSTNELIFLGYLYDDLVSFYERLGFVHINENIMVLDRKVEALCE